MTPQAPFAIRGPVRRSSLLALFLVGWLSALSLAAAEPVHVRYRSAETVYLDNGTAAGLAVGDALDVVHDGRTIGRLEVIFTATRSASCRVVEENAPITAGDLVRPLDADGNQVADTETDDAPGSIAAPAATATAANEAAAGATDAAPATSGDSAQAATTPDWASSYSTSRSTRRPTTRVSGSFTLDYENFTDDEDEIDFGYSRLVGRLSLRLRDIGGTPYQFRLRLRSSQIDRNREPGADIPSTETRNRFYEAALIYDKPDGKYSYRIGRLGSSPFTGIGYLDGALGHYQITPAVAVGGFFGGRSDVTDIGFETSGLKYGLFARFRATNTLARRPFEIYVAGVREDGDEVVNREYLALETHWDGGRIWSFYQRAELDVNRDWRRDVSGSATQLSTLSVATTARFSERSRVVISYNMYQRYRTEVDRFLPDELFNDLLRQGLRVSYRHSAPRGLSYTVDGGLRDQDGNTDLAYFFGGSVRHNNLFSRRYSLGGNVLVFSNPFTEGILVRVRTAKRFISGHRIDLDFGGRVSSHRLYDDQEDTVYQWVRLGGWLELPRRFFVRGEIELSFGDELQGQRLNVGLGYRF